MTPDRLKNITSWTNAGDEELKKIKGVCLDVDDTLSTNGKLTAEAYSALWALYKSGIATVVVTGRCAGWCDHIARFWPVDAVVGENGAFVFFMKDAKRTRLDYPGSIESLKKLAQVRKKMENKFPFVSWASDQSYREYDLAIDFCEDVPPWSEEKIQNVLDFCKKEGAVAKLSSIHINLWFGEQSKSGMVSYWLKQGAPGLEKRMPPPSWGEWLFVGDSPNDESLFKAFEFSVGVANLRRFISKIKHPPRWITDKNSGEGFCEVVGRLLKLS